MSSSPPNDHTTDASISEDSLISAIQNSTLDGAGKIDYPAIAKQLKQRFESTQAATSTTTTNDKNEDDDHHRFIHIDQLRQMIEDMSLNVPQDVIEEAIMCGDVNEDGINIDFYEFIGALVTDLDDDDDTGDIRRAFELFFESEERPVIVGPESLLRALRAAFKPLTREQLALLLDGFDSVAPNEYNFGNFLVLYHAADDLIQ